MKLATTLSLIGAIVGEYFGGSSLVLGRIIVQSSSALRFDITWAAILLAAATGIVFYLVVVALERIVIPWHASMRATEAVIMRVGVTCRAVLEEAPSRARGSRQER